MSSIGANVGLQFLFSSLGLATSSLVLARDRLWKWLDAVDVYSSGNLQQIRNFNNSLANPDSQWYSAWLELGMAWYVGFASIWLLSVFLFCATLKWPVPLLAVPNVAISVMGVFANLALFGAILAWLLELPNDLRTDGHEQKMLIGASGFFGICAIFSLIFTGLSSHHYNTLKKIMRARNRQITPDSPSSLDQQRADTRKKEAADFYKT